MACCVGRNCGRAPAGICRGWWARCDSNCLFIETYRSGWMSCSSRRHNRSLAAGAIGDTVVRESCTATAQRRGSRVFGRVAKAVQSVCFQRGSAGRAVSIESCKRGAGARTERLSRPEPGVASLGRVNNNPGSREAAVLDRWAAQCNGRLPHGILR